MSAGVALRETRDTRARWARVGDLGGFLLPEPVEAPPLEVKPGIQAGVARRERADFRTVPAEWSRAREAMSAAERAAQVAAEGRGQADQSATLEEQAEFCWAPGAHQAA